MQEEKRRLAAIEDKADDGPQVYQVQKDTRGWTFSRRDFLAAAGTTAAAVAAGTLSGCGEPSAPEIVTRVVTPLPPGFGVVTRVVTPGPAEPALTSGGVSPGELLAACTDVRAHEEEIYALAVTPDGRYFVSGGEDETIKIWTLPERALVGVVNDVQETVFEVALSPDSGHMAVARSKRAEWRSLPGGDLEVVFDLPEEQYLTLALSPDGQLLALSCADETVYVWSLVEGRQVAAVEGHGATVGSLAITPDGTLLITGGKDGRVGLWRLPAGELLNFLASHTGFIGGLAVNPAGTLLASGGADKTIHLWSLPEGDLLAELEGHEDVITELAITPHGSMLISCSVDGTIRLWSLPGGESLGMLDHGGEVYNIAVSPGGTWLASAGADGTIKFWSLPGGEFAACAVDPEANSDEVEVITYEVVVESGRTIVYAQPASIPIPAGVVCVCNTVSGAIPSCSCVGHTSCSCVGHSPPSGGHYWYPC